MKDLASVGATERDEFIKSVDNVICDLDGVIWLFGQPIAGAADCLAHLRNLGKTVMFITNNGMMEVGKLRKMIEDAGFGNDPVVINPTLVLIYYLKSIKFDKLIYVISSPCTKKALTEAGFNYVADESGPLDLELYDLPNVLKDDERIGAVLVDWEINASIIKLQKAILYLRRPEVLFLEGATDSCQPAGNNITVIGPKYIQSPVEQITGRKPTTLAKPSVVLKDYMQNELNIGDPARTLFVGDTIEQDMGFGTLAGYKKLLVLSGNAKKDDVLNWKHDENFKPDYFIDSLGVLYDLLSNKSKK